MVSKGRLDQKTSDEALDRIKTSLDLGDLAECDLVVEAIPEVLDLKTSTFNRLDAICKPSAILASNTSSISINTIAESTSRPERVIGMHFMNPVPIMKLVEVINGTHTTELVTSEVISVIEALGKTPLQCNDSPGFVSNRILSPNDKRGNHHIGRGVAEVDAIDGIMKPRDEPPHRPPCIGRPDRPGYGVEHHAGSARGTRRREVCSISIVGVDGQRGQIGKKNQNRFLQLLISHSIYIIVFPMIQGSV